LSENISNRQLSDDPIDFNPAVSEKSSSKIPDGVYLMELGMGKYGISGFASQGKTYASVQVEGKIIAPGTRYDGWRANGFINNMPFKDSTDSPLLNLHSAAGSTATATTNRELGAITEQLLAGSPQVACKIRWETKRIKDAQGKYHQVKGMKNFPANSEGGYEPFVTLEVDGVLEELEAYPTIYGFTANRGAATS
jgi:hypothetical protein